MSAAVFTRESAPIPWNLRVDLLGFKGCFSFCSARAAVNAAKAWVGSHAGRYRPHQRKPIEARKLANARPQEIATRSPPRPRRRAIGEHNRELSILLLPSATRTRHA
jgi:hypothetical protein